MTAALLEGIILGLTLALLVGPGFISLVQTSISRGVYSGIQFAIGIALSDLLLIGLSYFGLLQLFGSHRQHLALGIIGGGILIVFGVINYQRKYSIPSHVHLKIPPSGGRFFKDLSKGFFLNITNPFLLIFWVGITGIASAKYGLPSPEIIVFFGATLAAVFATDVFKVFISQKIRRFLSIRVLTYINRLVGVLLISFGVFLIIRVLFFL